MTGWWKLGPLLVAAACALLLVACSSKAKNADGGSTATPFDTPISLPTSVAAPTSLPQHLGLGLMNNPQQLDWMTSSGIPFDYRYQYLTGGVNTDSGWNTWGYPAGSFVDDYLQASADGGYLPVFTYYQIVPSSPEPGSEDVFKKLRDASTMHAYFDDWQSLMQQLGVYGNTAIVHVEPDLWAYMQLDDSDASKVKVDVQSSGASSVADFADTAAGFAQALIHLRDQYAPNVLLAWHVSSWATGKDLTINKPDPADTAAKIAAFYRTLGADFDLLFIDASDRDAAWYQIQRGDKNHWWKDADFARFGSFVAETVRDIGKRAVIWQIPVGNTLYRSMDNSWGHYQDNRAQYWLGDRAHLQQLADAGVVALLFGAGADGCTMYDDEVQDGVTNPQPINGNDAEAQYADDDGGYLRQQAAAYYQAGPTPLPAATAP